MKTTDNGLLIEQFLAEGLAGKSVNTIKTYKAALTHFADYLADNGTDLQGYGRTDVQFYVNYLQDVQRRAASGVNAVLAAIRAYSRYTGKAEAVEDIRTIKAQKLTGRAPQWIDRNTANAIMRQTDRKANKRDHAIVMTLLGCGLRVSELVALERADITLNERSGTLHVRDGKGGKERHVSIPADTRRALTAYFAQRTDNEPAAFLSSLGKRVSVRAVQVMLKEYDVTPHQLRHTFVKRLVDEGTPLALIMSLSGHESAEMIAWYSAPTDGEKQSAVERIFN